MGGGPPGEAMRLTPTSFAATGEAVGRAEDDRGKIVAVRVVGGIVGEEADVRVGHRGGNFVHAHWVGSPAFSPDRVDPGCEHVEACGGCPWLHISRTRAHAERAARVEAVLAAAGVHVHVEPRAAPPNEGRHVVKLVGLDGPRGVRIGAYQPHSHEVMRISGCIALAPKLRALTRLPLLDVPEGIIRHLIARESSLDGAVLATLVVRDDHPSIRTLEGVFRRAGVGGLAVHRNTRPGDGILDPTGPTSVLWGVPRIREWVHHDGEPVVVEIGPTDFFQTNPVVGRQIWADLPDPGPLLVDLYCGVGAVAFALWARDRQVRVFGVEENPGAIERARATAARLGAAATFAGGAAGSVPLPEGFTGATVVLNPPRKGTSEAVRQQVDALRPRAIVLISCHPEPMARDLAAWTSTGWRVDSATAYEMFPGTSHVETVAVLTRAG